MKEWKCGRKKEGGRAGVWWTEGYGVEGTHAFVMTMSARILSLSMKWSMMYAPMLGALRYKSKRAW